MKRNSLPVIMVLIAAVFSVSLSACGNQTGKEANATEAETTVEETDEEIEEEADEETDEEIEEEADEEITGEIEEEADEETNEEIEEETEEEIEEETEAEIVEETKKEVADYTVEDIEAKTMYASTSLNVRTGPSTEYSKAGSLSVNEAVTVTGVADTGWYRLDYNGAEVYVSNKYLQDTQVAVTVASTDTTSTDTTSTASTASTDSMDGWVYGGLDQLIDGEWMAIYWNDDTGEMKYVSTGRYADIGNSVQESQFMESMAREAFDIVNQYRADVGLDALTWNDAIYEGTKIRAQELVASYSHTRPNGERCSTVISDFSYVGENIARGQGSASHVCNSWYNSEGHRNNMLNENYTKGAIACWYENGTYYWVNLFSM